MVVTFPDEARRARLVARHRLTGAPTVASGAPTVASGAAAVVDLARGLVALHATDPATPYLSARARLAGFEVGHLEEALYARRSVTKHLAMRRTLFVVADDLLATVQAACTEVVVANERRRLRAEVERAGVATDGAPWLDGAGAAVVRALAERGPSTGAALSRTVPEIQAKTSAAEGKPWGGPTGVATRVLTILEAERRIRRGPPGGGWTSSQHRWELAPPPVDLPPEADAVRSLVERWLRAFGPATVDDVVWWTGLGVRTVRAALGGLDVVEVAFEHGTGVGLADDLEPDALDPDHVEARPVLLPALDPTAMGWKHRSWYLGDHGPRLFDRNGNVGPTVWLGGRIVGGWAQRRSGEVVVRLLEDLGAAVDEAVGAEAAALERWLDGTVVSPRFPGPLAIELRA